MKEIYKAKDGKVFERKSDCLIHEFELNGGNENFNKLVREAANAVEALTGLRLEVIKAEAKIGWDGNPNTEEHEYVEWQTVDIKIFNKDGSQRGEDFSRGSQGGFTKESLVDDLLTEYHVPFQKVHEGIIEDSNDGWLVPEGYMINGVNVNDILRNNYGKRIKLEILD
jgi:hypothetical protein